MLYRGVSGDLICVWIARNIATFKIIVSIRRIGTITTHQSNDTPCIRESLLSLAHLIPWKPQLQQADKSPVGPTRRSDASVLASLNSSATSVCGDGPKTKLKGQTSNFIGDTADHVVQLHT